MGCSRICPGSSFFASPSRMAQRLRISDIRRPESFLFFVSTAASAKAAEPEYIGTYIQPGMEDAIQRRRGIWPL